MDTVKPRMANSLFAMEHRFRELGEDEAVRRIGLAMELNGARRIGRTVKGRTGWGNIIYGKGGRNRNRRGQWTQR